MNSINEKDFADLTTLRRGSETIESMRSTITRTLKLLTSNLGKAFPGENPIVIPLGFNAEREGEGIKRPISIVLSNRGVLIKFGSSTVSTGGERLREIIEGASPSIELVIPIFEKLPEIVKIAEEKSDDVKATFKILRAAAALAEGEKFL